MAKRKLTSLRSVLLRYLLLCGGGCALILVLWWVIFMQLINIGFLLPWRPPRPAPMPGRL